MRNPFRKGLLDERGATAVIVGVTVIVLFSFAALAVDISHIIGVRKELKNATDAGALAGAMEIFTPRPGGGYFVQEAQAIAEATTVATSHLSQLTNVEVNQGDVMLGHWRFADDDEGLDARFFPIPNPPAEMTAEEFSGLFDDVNKDATFLNAIQVRGRREVISVVAFFAGIFGIESFTQARTSVAFLGPVGSWPPGSFEGGPIAICQDKITKVDGTLECNIGRMSTDSNSTGEPETAAWTDFTQGADVSDCPTASAREVRDVVDGADPPPAGCFQWENPDWLTAGLPMGATNGVGDTNYRLIQDCWRGTTEWPSLSVDHDDDPDTPDVAIDADGFDGPERSVDITLPVVSCADHPCYYLTGAVKVKLLWVSRDGQVSINENGYREVPMRLDDWTCPLIDPASPSFVSADLHTNTPSDVGQSPAPPTNMTWDQRKFCWDDFFSHFGIALPPGWDMTEPTLQSKTMYFIPACEGEILSGGPGGNYFGVLSSSPKLVL